jgi:hypothetical protein
MTPNLAAARDAASSPSGWASFCDAAGLNPKGRDTWVGQYSSVWGAIGDCTFVPRIRVLMSTCSTFRRILGRIWYRSKADSLSRSLYFVSEVEGTRAQTYVTRSIAPSL